MVRPVSGNQDFEPNSVPPVNVPPVAGAPQSSPVKQQSLPPAVRDSLAAAANAAASTKKPNPAQDPMGSAYITAQKITVSEGGTIPLPMPGIAYYAAEAMLEDI